MKYYFRLQFSRIKRQLEHLGFPPYIGMVLSIIGFFALSHLLFFKISLAIYIYPLLAIYTLLQFSENDRNRFIGLCYDKKTYRQIRVIENSLLILPFIVYLSLRCEFLLAGLIFLFSFVYAFFPPLSFSTFAIKTPFYKYPYEFLRGFRISYPIFIGLAILAIIGIVVHNFNLAAFTILIATVSCMSFYSEVESPYFIWIHKHDSRAFLLYKIKTSIIYISIILLPLIFLLAFFFIDKLILLFLFCAIAYLYLITNIVAKYAIYPKQVNLPMAIILAVGYLIPALLLLYIPYFFKKSIVQLDKILT